MVDLSVQIEIAGGLSWERWARLVAEVDRLGYRGLYICDHFFPPGTEFTDSVEIFLAFAHGVSHSQRLEFGSLVSPVSFRDPRFLIRQAMHLDNLSGGRFVLGVGAGWMEREHNAFGYELGDKRTRSSRLAEALEVMSLLNKHEEPVSFDGSFYKLREAKILPRAARPGGVRIMVGGSGPRRTLPLTARYADVWNTGGRPPEQYREISMRLDELLVKNGRQPRDLRRTLMVQVVPIRNESEILPRLRHVARQHPGQSPKELLAGFRERSPSAIVGTPAECIERIAAYAAAGVEEIMVQRLDLDDDEGLRVIAEEVAPHVK